MGVMAELMQAYVEQENLHQLEGATETAIEGVFFYRSSQGCVRQPLTYSSGILIMGQGTKVVYLGDQSVRYSCGSYLTVGVPLPLECEATTDQGKPLLSICVNIAPELLHRLVDQLQRNGVAPETKNANCGLCSEQMSPTMEDACHRLLKALLNPIDADMLGKSIVEEIVYRVLTGSKGYVLYDLARHDGHYARIARVLRQMHENYALPVSVDELASSINMSVPSFHRAFRQVTSESPLQYLKKIRLNKAKELMTLEGKKANEAALLVGYSSPSQFSREYKRHFDATPKAAL